MPVMDITNTNNLSAELSSRLPGQPWDLNDVAGFLNVCRKTVERGIRDQKVKAIRIGRRVLIPDAAVRRVAECGL